MANGISGETIIVEGMRELARAMKETGDPKLIGEAHKRIGAFVVEKADERADNLAPRFPSYRLLKTRASAAKTSVAVFGRKPYGHAAEFGMKKHIVFGRGYPADQMKRRVWPEHSGDGYLFHPVLRDEHDQIVSLYQQAIEEVARKVWDD